MINNILRGYKFIAIILLFVIITSLLFYKGLSRNVKFNKIKKLNIGYIESGPYIDYPIILRNITEGLMELGELPIYELPSLYGNNDSKVVWDVLTKIESKKIQFIEGGYWSSNWYSDKINELREKIKREIKEKNINLIIAMGTLAGQIMANEQFNTPTVVVHSVDPVKSGITNSCADFKFPHIYTMCKKDMFERQIQIFYRLIDFKRLGVIYENSEYGKTVSAIDQIQKASIDLDFQIIPCYAEFLNVSYIESKEQVSKCFNYLSNNTDAIF
ncbi:MAG: ABC transporter substrate binding protein, partial [Nanoarchaeota archaeon]